MNKPTKFKLMIQKSGNSFGDQIVTVYLVGPQGTETFHFLNHEGSHMSVPEIIKTTCREAGIERKDVSSE